MHPFEQGLGADIVYAEGLDSIDEMRALNAAVSVPTILAQVERPGVALISGMQYMLHTMYIRYGSLACISGTAQSVSLTH